MTNRPTVSVVLNADGPAQGLETTLRSLEYMTYPRFEVCVIIGPTFDGDALLERWRDCIKVASCAQENLSASRNIGITLAAGDIVAFIGHGAIPEPEWLSDIAHPFESADVGAAGGFVYNHTGIEYQCRYATMDRLARSDLSWERPTPEFNFPFSNNFPHLLTTNFSVRRDAAIAIGGFDEEFDCILGEADIVCRLNDGGWKIAQVDGGRVHKKYKDSDCPNDIKAIGPWHSFLKSKIYFSVLNGRRHHTLGEAIEEARRYVDEQRKSLESAGLTRDRVRFSNDIDRGWRKGLIRGLSGQRRFMRQEALAKYYEPFLKFETVVCEHYRTMCFLSQTYPPGSIGGIGRHVHQLARSVARLGHQVHVLTSGSERDTVTFEDGVWVHRICPKRQCAPAMPNGLRMPQDIWDYSASMLAEVKRLARIRPIDGVFAPIWHCEGIAFLLDGSFPLVTSLHTTLAHFLESHGHHITDPAFANDYVRPMLAGEKLLIERSDVIVANSKAIAREIEKIHNTTVQEARLAFLPHGLDDWTTLAFVTPSEVPDGNIRVLFVGRLEERKGIDVFLEAAKTILQAHPHVHLDIIGADGAVGRGGVTYRAAFLADREYDAVRKRVSFHGEVSDEVLRGYYRACDIFVAPSRFESFGLVLLEAMMFGKAVIGCRSGGMMEIIEHGVCGFLAEPGDVPSLIDCLHQLIDNVQLRTRLGAEARRRYETSFTSEATARGTLQILFRLAEKARDGALQPVPIGFHAPCGELAMYRRAQRVEHGGATQHRIAIITGTVACNDAVSASVRDTYGMLSSQPAFSVSVFAQRNECPDVPCHIMADTAHLLLHPDYLAADLIIWHFAICYELFDAVLVGNNKARQVVVYHNITPKEYLPKHSWPLIERSLQQRHHLRCVDEVWNDSSINATDARAAGVASNRLRVIPLPVDKPVPSALAEKGRSVIDILFVGRFVKSKGILDLVDAVARLVRRDLVAFRLTLVGNLALSDSAYVDELRAKIADLGLSHHVVFLGTIDDTERDNLYRRAHILAIPSYHEGFCKPVIEGLRAGCIPLGYANSNLPEVADGLGRIVSTGDIGALSGALQSLLLALPAAIVNKRKPVLPLDRKHMSVTDFDRMAREYVQRFSQVNIAKEMQSRLYTLLNMSRVDQPLSSLASARDTFATADQAATRGDAADP